MINEKSQHSERRGINCDKLQAMPKEKHKGFMSYSGIISSSAAHYVYCIEDVLGTTNQAGAECFLRCARFRALVVAEKPKQNMRLCSNLFPSSALVTTQFSGVHGELCLSQEEVSVLPEHSLGHLHYDLTGLPPSPNSPPNTVSPWEIVLSIC